VAPETLKRLAAQSDPIPAAAVPIKCRRLMYVINFSCVILKKEGYLLSKIRETQDRERECYCYSMVLLARKEKVYLTIL
jgi:hypothetical protein